MAANIMYLIWRTYLKTTCTQTSISPSSTVSSLFALKLSNSLWTVTSLAPCINGRKAKNSWVKFDWVNSGWSGCCCKLRWPQAHPRMGIFFQNFWGECKVLHVVCRSNHCGRYLEISEFHCGSRQGFICIPEGKMGRHGWISMRCYVTRL